MEVVKSLGYNIQENREQCGCGKRTMEVRDVCSVRAFLLGEDLCHAVSPSQVSESPESQPQFSFPIQNPFLLPAPARLSCRARPPQEARGLFWALCRHLHLMPAINTTSNRNSSRTTQHLPRRRLHKHNEFLQPSPPPQPRPTDG